MRSLYSTKKKSVQPEKGTLIKTKLAQEKDVWTQNVSFQRCSQMEQPSKSI